MVVSPFQKEVKSLMPAARQSILRAFNDHLNGGSYAELPVLALGAYRLSLP